MVRGVPNLGVLSLSQKDRLSALASPQSKELAGKVALARAVIHTTTDSAVPTAFRFAAELDYPVYPGRKLGAPYTFEHQITIMARALLLFTIARPAGPSFVAQIRQLCDAQNDSVAACSLETSAPIAMKHGRLFAPKILAIPGKLSYGEYNMLLLVLAQFWVIQGDRSVANAVTSLGECQMLSSGCPALRDYTGDESAGEPTSGSCVLRGGIAGEWTIWNVSLPFLCHFGRTGRVVRRQERSRER